MTLKAQKQRHHSPVSAYKNALRNSPSDDESRYNLALAQECAKEQGDGKGEDKDKDENKDDKENSDENKDNEEKNKDKGGEDEEKKEGDDKEGKMESLKMIMEIKMIKTQTKTKDNQSHSLEKWLLNK